MSKRQKRNVSATFFGDSEARPISCFTSISLGKPWQFRWIVDRLNRQWAEIHSNNNISSPIVLWVLIGFISSPSSHLPFLSPPPPPSNILRKHTIRKIKCLSNHIAEQIRQSHGLSQWQLEMSWKCEKEEESKRLEVHVTSICGVSGRLLVMVIRLNMFWNC